MELTIKGCINMATTFFLWMETHGYVSLNVFVKRWKVLFNGLDIN